jgi:transcriptional regulator with XRE-family HTH domain
MTGEKEEIREIMHVLKTFTKAAGFTQARLAKTMQVSLPSVKRWFAGEGVSLHVLLQILKITGHDLEDLRLILPASRARTFEYTLEQERFFADSPGHLSFFDQLLLGKTPKQIRMKFKLSGRSLRRYLSALEKLGLITVMVNDRVVLNVQGSPVWRSNGPLNTRLGRRAVDSFIDKYWMTGDVELYLHRYTDEDLAKLEELIHGLISFARQANRRSKIDKSRDRGHGLILGLKPFSFDALKEIPNL